LSPATERDLEVKAEQVSDKVRVLFVDPGSYGDDQGV
jgi:hypothetical protein